MKKIFIYIFIGFFTISCHDDVYNADNNTESDPVETPTSVSGVQSIRLRPEVLKTINNQLNELSIPTGSITFDEYLNSIGAYKIQRVFPYAGKYEHQQVAEGLNAWYTVWIDSDLKKKSTYDSNIVDYVEPVFKPRIEDYEITVAPSLGTKSASEARFNDPGFTRQWDMLNKGVIGNYEDGDQQIISSIAGADINIQPAWAEETGNPNVIVSIVDGGIDIYHEDLIDNLWINEGEIPGNGIDDDNNGYIDDVYGFNFVTGTGVILPHDHGTHVAGVIAARNDNGKGICGIAGGDGTANSGVKLMSCQMFMDNPDYDPNDPDSPDNISTTTNETAAAIVYGANNGAIISQNSWGYDIGVLTPKVVKDAIAYFTKYAGQNNPNSMMNGGLVVFAASNDNTEIKTYPAADPAVISVAAYAPDFAAAWYSNYGTWVDIIAPGGSGKSGQKYPIENGAPTSAIYSTIASQNGESKYGYMQGTSMACPHVSGIAALVVSKYGNKDFPVSELRQRILTGVKRLNPNDYNISKYYDKLGRGYIDAQVALAELDSNLTLDNPVFVPQQMEQGYASLSLAWKSSSSTNHEWLQYYVLYSSDKEITTSNYLESNVSQTEIVANYVKPDDVLMRTISNLESGKTYYFAVQAFARNGNSSDLIIYEGGVSTLPNTPPSIETDTNLNDVIVLAGNDMQEIIFAVKDAENHEWDYNLSYKEQLFAERTGDNIRIRIFANKFVAGNRKITLTTTDQYGASSSVDIQVKIESDNPPRFVSNVASVNVHLDSPKTISLTDLIEDEDPSSLIFSLGALSNDNVRVSLSGDKLIITPQRAGQNELSFTVMDKHKQQTEVILSLFVYQNEGIYSLYPTLTSNTLYVKLGDVIDGQILLRVRNSMGKQALEKTYNTKDIDSQKRTLLVNVASLFPGKYELSITNNGKTYKESFIKE